MFQLGLAIQLLPSSSLSCNLSRIFPLFARRLFPGGDVYRGDSYGSLDPGPGSFFIHADNLVG